MVPSFVMWPMIITGVLVSLANLRRETAHSFTWETLPAEDSTAVEKMVWMESMIISSGFMAFAWSIMLSREVSGRM